jgi:hypothetical protein
MLAVVDHLTHTRMQIRTRPPAEITAPFHKPHAKTRLS